MINDVLMHAQALIAAIHSGLKETGGEGVEETLTRLMEQQISGQTFRQPEPLQKAVCEYLPATLASAADVAPALSASLSVLAPQLRWLQSPSYTDAVLGEGFSQNYAWCEIIGPQGFFPGFDFLLGFLLLGPHRHYKDHFHPAPELYWPLTAHSDWKKGDGPFIPRAAGEVIWHPSMAIHATITYDKPLLAVFAWTNDTEIGARLI